MIREFFRHGGRFVLVLTHSFLSEQLFNSEQQALTTSVRQERKPLHS